jgi:hypothetical protein
MCFFYALPPSLLTYSVSRMCSWEANIWIS